MAWFPADALLYEAAHNLQRTSAGDGYRGHVDLMSVIVTGRPFRVRPATLNRRKKAPTPQEPR